MGAREDLRRALLAVDPADWDGWLLARSGLPGPRSNLELLAVVADEADAARLLRYAALPSGPAGDQDPVTFLACCGVVGLGRLVLEGREALLADVRRHAGDPRWRVREAVAMALQRIGDADVGRMLTIAGEWATGSRLEQRAAAAGACEPRLLRREADARAVVAMLDTITTSMRGAADRRTEGFVTLRKAMGYCWSVAVAAVPDVGRAALEGWLDDPDPDIRWLMRENLRKHRLARLDPDWLAGARARVGA